MKRGFTLVEMLVVMVIIAVLVSLLVPAINMGRAAAQSTACKNNLRQFYVGMTVHANSDPKNQLCTGAFDWKRDGSVVDYGWVADLVNQGIIVGDMLCPSNPNRLNEKFNDLLGLVPTGLDSCGVDLAGRSEEVLPDGSLRVNPCRQILGNYSGGTPLEPGSEERRLVVERDILQEGYNTNYAASWYLVRSGVSVNESGNLVGDPGCPISLKERSSTTGPLRMSQLDNAQIPSHRVPLLGCASPGDVREAVLSMSLGDHKQGDRLVESFCDGPVDKTTMKAPEFADGTPYGGPDGWWTIWSNQTLQDYRDFGPVHNGDCNVLFGDGSVHVVTDENGDGFLNNGFDPTIYTGQGSIGFRSPDVELAPQLILSTWSLTDTGKGNLDQQ